MRFIHTADIHLGSKMEAKLSKQKAETRQSEIRVTFSKIVEYARINGIKLVVLSGDVFDSDKPTKKDKDIFYSVIRNNPEIDFLYLRGNHDQSTVHDDEYLNLHRFTSRWSSYEFEGVVFSGIEMNPSNCESMYSTLLLDQSKKNVVMLHGQISDSVGYELINLNKLRNKGIDYLALGHIHKGYKGKLDERGMYVYPGCPEGRGFDEPGHKTFTVVDTDDFEKLMEVCKAKRTIWEYDLDISECKDAYAIAKKIRTNLNININDMYRINLVGSLPFDIGNVTKDVEHLLEDYCFYASIKDKTEKPINVEKYANEMSLAGEFVRRVLKDTKLKPEEKEQIIILGLNALNGKEFE